MFVQKWIYQKTNRKNQPKSVKPDAISPPQFQKPDSANVIIYSPGFSVLKRFCDVTTVSSLFTFRKPNDVENVFCL